MTEKDLLIFLETAKHGDYVDFKLNGVEVKRARISKRGEGDPLAAWFYLCHDGEEIDCNACGYKDDFGFKTTESMGLLDHGKFEYIRHSEPPHIFGSLQAGDVVVGPAGYVKIIEILIKDNEPCFILTDTHKTAELARLSKKASWYFAPLAALIDGKYRKHAPQKVTMKEVYDKFGHEVIIVD